MESLRLTQRLEGLLGVDNFKAWLRGKDPEDGYRFMDNENCVVAEYLKENGFSWALVGGYQVSIYSNNEHSQVLARAELPKAMTNVLSRGTTYGGLLKLMEEQK